MFYLAFCLFDKVLNIFLYSLVKCVFPPGEFASVPQGISPISDPRVCFFNPRSEWWSLDYGSVWASHSCTELFFSFVCVWIVVRLHKEPWQILPRSRSVFCTTLGRILCILDGACHCSTELIPLFDGSEGLRCKPYPNNESLSLFKTWLIWLAQQWWIKAL